MSIAEVQDLRLEAGPGRLKVALAAFRHPLAILGLVIASAWLLIAIFAPLIAPHDPLDQSLVPLQGPGSGHWFGTDELGRDVLSRVLYGARLSLPLALLLVGLAVVIGGAVGGVAGYFGGFVDGPVMRWTDPVFAVPAVLLARG